MTTTAAEPFLAHHFENMEQQREALTLGMWVFLVTEMMFFGGLFIAYTVYRVQFPEAFVEGSHHLDFTLGTLNTTLLLVSSFTVVLAVHAAQTDRRKSIAGFLALTMVLGTAFLGVKGVEYWHKYEEWHIPGAKFELTELENEDAQPRNVELFFSLYFAMTGLHALHMVIGVGVFAVILAAALRGRYSREHYMPVELAGLYWHFVDIVWVFLYPMLYLVS